MAEWKSIKGAPGYLVSDEGQVKRAKYAKIYVDGSRVDVDEKILNRRIDSGYVYVCFNSKCYAVHRLVAAAFLEPSNKFSYIKFIDGDKTNCAASNLEWISGSDYAKQAIADGTRPSIQPYKGVKIKCIETEEIFQSIKEAAASANVSRAIMTRALRNHQSIDDKHYEKLS